MGARSNIHVWDVGVESSSQTLPKAATLQTLEVPTSGSVASLAFSSDGEFLAAAGTDEQHTVPTHLSDWFKFITTVCLDFHLALVDSSASCEC